MKRLVLTHKDRLMLFMRELVFSLCELQGVEAIVINADEQPQFKEEPAKDVLEIITVFSARFHGSRSRKSKKMIESLSDGNVETIADQMSLL